MKELAMDSGIGRAVHALPGLVWTALPDGNVDFVNERWCDYTGLCFDEGHGQGWQKAVHSDDLPALLERWQCALASGEPCETQARLRRFDGSYRLFLLCSTPSADAADRIVRWCGIAIDIDERIRREEASYSRWWLSATGREHHFRTIVDSLWALAANVTPAGVVEHVNHLVLEYFGATLDEINGWKLADVVHPDDLSEVVSAWRQGIESGQPYNLEVRLRRADGVYRWFHARSFPLRDTEGRIVLWYFLMPDVDDRKWAEALLAGEKSLLEMVARGHSMSETLDRLCRLVERSVSGCFCSVTLVDSRGIRLKPGAAPTLPETILASMVGRPLDSPSGPCAMAAAFAQQVIVSDLRIDGRWAVDPWARAAQMHGLQACWSTPIASTSGGVLGVLTLLHKGPKVPTTQHQALIDRFTHVASIAIEREQSENALKRSEAFLAESQRLSSTGGLIWHLSTDELTWSDEVYRIFDLDPALAATLELTMSRIHPEDVPAFEEMRDRQVRDVRDFEHDYRLLMPDRSVKYLHVVAHATRDEDDEWVYHAVVQDVTEGRLAGRALDKARSELAHVARITTLGALTASIAHEVNQPLSGIVTNASTCLRMLAADPPNVEGARETARRAIRDGNRAADVIRRLRALFAKEDTRTDVVDLNDATREVIALSLSELQSNEVIVRLELAEHLPSVPGDRVQLQQVILNLILNASEAMIGIDGRVRQLVVRTERDDPGRVVVSVRDSGVGFSPEGSDMLFESFYTTKSHGMGIGLSVSRSIIESHGGRLWATPNNESGATFSFSVPRQPEHGSQTRAVPERAHGI